MLVLINDYTVINFDQYIPVVESLEDAKLIGIVKVYHCLEYLSMIGDVLVKEFSKKKQLAKNLGAFKEKMAFERILEVKHNLEGSYKMFGKITEEFHTFITNMKKSEAQIHYGKHTGKPLLHTTDSVNRTKAQKSVFGKNLDNYSQHMGDQKSQFGGSGRGSLFGKRRESLHTIRGKKNKARDQQSNSGVGSNKRIDPEDQSVSHIRLGEENGRLNEEFSIFFFLNIYRNAKYEKLAINGVCYLRERLYAIFGRNFVHFTYGLEFVEVKI